MIDLDRLREAIATSNLTTPVAAEIVRELEAVADAPTVWWCADVNGLAESEIEFGCWADVHKDAGCGRVALVPVKGGQE